jgi:adenylate kinase
MKLDLVLNVRVAPEILVERLIGRRICRQCGTPYHLAFSPPTHEGICDRCGGELYQRSDDTLETVSDRLLVYTNQTAPLLDFYRQRHLLQDIDGEPDIDVVWASIIDCLRSLGQ